MTRVQRVSKKNIEHDLNNWYIKISWILAWLPPTFLWMVNTSEILLSEALSHRKGKTTRNWTEILKMLWSNGTAKLNQNCHHNETKWFFFSLPPLLLLLVQFSSTAHRRATIILMMFWERESTTRKKKWMKKSEQFYRLSKLKRSGHSPQQHQLNANVV